MAKKKKRSKLQTKEMMRSFSVSESRRVIRVGRNELCPCGSGKKYKDCHSAQGEVFLQRLTRQRDKERRLREQKEAGASWLKQLLTRLGS